VFFKRRGEIVDVAQVGTLPVDDLNFCDRDGRAGSRGHVEGREKWAPAGWVPVWLLISAVRLYLLKTLDRFALGLV